MNIGTKKRWIKKLKINEGSFKSYLEEGFFEIHYYINDTPYYIRTKASYVIKEN